jgi:hypothetical protein
MIRAALYHEFLPSVSPGLGHQSSIGFEELLGVQELSKLKTPHTAVCCFCLKILTIADPLPQEFVEE